MATKNMITLKCYTDVVEEFPLKEILYPGHLVEQVMDSSVKKIQKHASSGGAGAAMFAKETGFAGYGIDDPYDPSGDNDKAQIQTYRSGDQVLAVLADGQNVSYGDYLGSNGDGTLTSDATGTAICKALEAKDLSGSSGEESSATEAYAEPLGYDVRIAVEIL